MSDEALKRYFIRHATRMSEIHAGDMCDCDLPCEIVVFAAEADHLISSLRQELKKLTKDRCEHCGGDNIYHGPPECSGCGAPICCQTCCRENTLEMKVAALRQELKEAREELHQARSALICARPHVQLSYARNPQHRGTAVALEAIDACFADKALAAEQWGSA